MERRFIQYFLLFFICLLAYFIRSSMSVTILAMIQPNSTNNNIKTYPEWQNKDVILSAFSWGYAILQIPAGFIGYRYSARYCLATGFFITSLATISIPLVADNFGSVGVICCRFLQGLTQGVLLPSIHHILAKWAPQTEKSRIFSAVYSATSIGPIISLPLTGVLINSPFGWPSVFYTYGLMTMIWSLIIACFSRNSPSEDCHLQLKERKYLEKFVTRTKEEENVSVPWKAMFASPAFWAIVLANIGDSFFFQFSSYEIPSFISGILQVDIRTNSLLSTLPFIAAVLAVVIFSIMSDFLVVRKILSVGQSRKLFQSLGTFGTSVIIICLSFTTREVPALVISLLMFALAMNMAMFVGYSINHTDIAPRLAGLLMGFSNSCGHCAAAVGPLIVHFIVKDQADILQWRKALFTAVGVLTVTGTVFVTFASGKMQPWNDSESLKNRRNKEENLSLKMNDDRA